LLTSNPQCARSPLHPPCGQYAISKPIHESAIACAILVIGEAPASDGWWISSRAFYRRTATGDLVVSKSGVNLNTCLAVLGTAIDEVGFVKAVRCWPDEPGPWRPPKRVRRRCLPFLDQHLRITQPSLLLPLGLVASASCLEVAFAQTGEDTTVTVRIPG
jgi:uracil-DNA glycosylase family 4